MLITAQLSLRKSSHIMLIEGVQGRRRCATGAGPADVLRLACLSAGATAWGTRVLKVDRRALEAEQRVQQPARAGEERMLYSCGAPMTGVDLRVVNPDTAEERRREGEVGEIWLSSPCVTVGYYNQPQLNREIFGVRT